MEGPLVSVIVGVYNKERFVGECLRSVLAQTYENWELIVVDDASTDGSLAEVERAVGNDPRVRILQRKTNSGLPAVARNEGIRAARGKYVAFIDADDLWKPEKLAVQTAYMEAHPEYPLTHTRCEEIDEHGNVLRVRHDGQLPPPGDCLRELFNHCFICTSTAMVRKNFGDELGWFSAKPEYRCGEDYDFFVRCAGKAKVGIPDGVWGCYRNLPQSISHDDVNWKATPSDYVRKRLFYGRKELWKGRVTGGEMRNIAWDAANENAWYWRSRKEWRKASWFAEKMLVLRPLSFRSWGQFAGAALKRR
jgi:glycosyltransferase involved in cell wall biosynthesis